jgi:glycosyltransferase involved in cell wall biosynthesis
MNEPLVSIIVPCHYQAQYLDEALQSILNQTYTNWECIIVDDGSPDNTEDIAKKWMEKDNRFKYVFQKNKGVSSARNLGIDRAFGKYIQFLDGDDILEKEKISYQIRILQKNIDIDVIYGSSRYFFNGDQKNLYSIHPKGIIPTIDLHKRDKDQKEVLLKRNICTICSAIYRKKVFEKIRFRETIYEDWIFHFECSLSEFTFHFNNSLSSYSFIRITNKSQMEKHMKEKEAFIKFKNQFDQLCIKYNFQSKFIKDDYVLKKTKFKVFLKDFLPPILYNFLTNKWTRLNQ